MNLNTTKCGGLNHLVVHGVFEAKFESKKKQIDMAYLLAFCSCLSVFTCCSSGHRSLLSLAVSLLWQYTTSSLPHNYLVYFFLLLLKNRVFYMYSFPIYTFTKAHCLSHIVYTLVSTVVDLPSCL